MKRIVFLLVTVAALATGVSAETRSRWLEIGQNNEGEKIYVDSKTVEYPVYRDAARKDWVIFWWKVTKHDGSQRVTRFQIKRSTRQSRSLASVRYSATGEVTESDSTPTEFIQIIPDTVGEMLCDFFDYVLADEEKPAPRRSTTTNM